MRASHKLGHIPFLCLFLTTAGMAYGAETIEYLRNGDLEEINDETGDIIECRYGGKGTAEIVADAHSGKRALLVTPLGPGDFDPVSNQGEYNAVNFGGRFADNQAVPLRPGVRYRFSVWIKGEGKVRLNVGQFSSVFLRTHFGEVFDVTPQWQKIEMMYTPDDDRRIWQGTPMVQVIGRGRVILDDASFRYEPEDNPNIAIEPPEEPTLPVTGVIQARDADCRLFLNGEPIDVCVGLADMTLREGINVLAVRATRTGSTPAVRMELPDHPQTLTRWRGAGQPEDGWMEAEFDDRKWSTVESGADGYMWIADDSESVCFRQVLIWNQTHYGPNYCLAPKIKTWGFPRNSVEPFALAIYSPLKRRIDGQFEFILDLPQGFRLLDKMNYEPRWIMNMRPDHMTTEVVKRNGDTFVRYRMTFRRNLQPFPQIGRSYLFVAMDREPVGNDVRFHYRRAMSKNVTELETSVPIQRLPPIDGRQPENILVSLFVSIPPHMPRPHMDALAAQAVRCGMNLFSFMPNPGWGERHGEHERAWYEAVLRHGGRFNLWLSVPLPIPGVRKGHLQWYPDWIQSHPEAQDRYFMDDPEWGSSPHHASGYCPAYVLSDDSDEFWEVVEKEADRFLRMFPETSMAWLDYEHHVLSADGTGSGGLTDRNKEAFRRWADLPETADLSDTNIVASYRGRWESFRNWQDGRIIARIRHMWNRKGMPVMLYSWAWHDLLWRNVTDRIDIAFPGTPGDHPADSYYQKTIDDRAAHFRETLGFPRIVGQRFPPRLLRTWTPGLGFCKALSHDGFADPASWKSQIVRIVATFGGGIDLRDPYSWGGGATFYIGEATRLIATYEDIFYAGQREDGLASSPDIAYPDLLVLRKQTQRLVLLFNEDETPRRVTLHNHEIPIGTVANIYEDASPVENPATIEVTIPARDVRAVHLYVDTPTH